MIDLLGKGGGGEAGAAAEIDGALEEGGLARRGARRQHRLEQQRRPAIAEIVDQRGLEARRVLIEQRLHIGLRHLGQGLGAEPHQVQAGAVAIVGIGGARLAKRLDRRVALAELLADFAEREPGRGEIRRELDGLHQQIGGGRQVALQLQIARKFEAAVGDQIAGGQEQARGHGSKLVIAGQVPAHRRDPAIHRRTLRRWMRGSSPRMTLISDRLYPGCARKTS